MTNPHRFGFFFPPVRDEMPLLRTCFHMNKKRRKAEEAEDVQEERQRGERWQSAPERLGGERDGMAAAVSQGGSR